MLRIQFLSTNSILLKTFFRNYSQLNPVTFFGVKHLTNPNNKNTSIAITGINNPYNYELNKTEQAPNVLRNLSSNFKSSREYLNDEVVDIGDIDLTYSRNYNKDIYESYDYLASQNINSLTVSEGINISPILKTYKNRFNIPISLIQFDSDSADYNSIRYSSKNLINTSDSFLVGNLSDYDSNSKYFDFDDNSISAEAIYRLGIQHTTSIITCCGYNPTFINFNLNVLRLLDAPGVKNPNADGLSYRMVMNILHNLQNINLVGVNFFGFIPSKDNYGVSGTHSVHILYKLLQLLCKNKNETRMNKKMMDYPKIENFILESNNNKENPWNILKM